MIEENQYGEDQGFKDDDINAMVNGIIDDSAPAGDPSNLNVSSDSEWASPLPETAHD